MIVGFFASVAIGATASALGREPEAREEVDLVLHDQLLREALRHVGRRTADVLDDQLDLPARDRVAVLPDVSPGAGRHLLAEVREGPGHLGDDADLDRVRGVRRGQRRCAGERERRGEDETLDELHAGLPVLGLMACEDGGLPPVHEHDGGCSQRSNTSASAPSASSPMRRAMARLRFNSRRTRFPSRPVPATPASSGIARVRRPRRSASRDGPPAPSAARSPPRWRPPRRRNRAASTGA